MRARRGLLSLSTLALIAGLASCGGGARTTTGGPTGPGGGGGSVAVPGTGGELPMDPAIKTGKLANGLTYYIRKNAKPEKRAELWLAVNAGSVLEDDDQRGVAHFVEHMSFNGTKKYAGQEIVDWLEKTGMKFGPDVNAMTSFDETVYQIQVPTDDPKLLAHGLDVLHEWAQGDAFDPKEVDKERGVVLSERRLGRGAQGRLLDKLFPAALPGSKYGERIPIGTLEILNTVKAETLKRFYQDWYRPDLMAVLVVGDVDPAAVETQLQTMFGDLANPANEKPRPTVDIPAQAKTIAITLQDPELPVTVVAVASKQPHRAVKSKDDLRAELTEQLFTAMLNQRLEELGKKPESPFLAAGVGKQAILRPIDVWFQGAVVKGDRLAEALEVLSTEIERVAKFGFTDGEIARAKGDLMHGYEVGAKEKDKTESRQYVEELQRVFLTGESSPGADAELALATEIVPAISAADLQAVAARAASDENRLVIAAGNSKTTLPAEAALIAAVDAGRAKASAAYVDDTAKGPLVPTPPTAGTITSEKQIAELGVTEWTLSNGVRVVLKPTDFKNDQVVLSGVALGGSSLASDADYVAARSADEIAEEGGAGALSATQLEKALAGTGVGFIVRFSRLEDYAAGWAQPEHLEQMFQLAYLRLTAPRQDDAAIEAWRASQVESRAHQLDDPATVFGARFDEVATSKHPRFRLLTGDDFAKLDVAKAFGFYKDRLSHLSGFTFVIVGNFTIDAIKPMVLTYLGGLPAGKAEAWKDIGVKRPKGVAKFEVKQGLEPKSTVHLLFHGKAAWSFAAAHDLDALAAALAIRLREELREGMGGTYGVSVHGELEREPKPEATLDIQFGCAPENVDKLVKAAMAQIALVQQKGPPAEVLGKIQEAERRARETQLKDNNFWLGELLQSYRFGDDPKHMLDDPKLTDGLTVKSLQAAARKYLGKDYVLGVLKPEAAKPAAQPKP